MVNLPRNKVVMLGGISILAKKHRSFKKDMAGLILQLEQQPTTGTELGNNC